ncbi:GAF and ANTAR domain-containing protein [Saccharopolyspora sp. HNM0983]|uniref:GAF and ANTAR domain-containing protein n=1 Tax=Saccharopolyspora montiporae TaxID=2781240 RepID=A0A929FY12_9PSEU|nr:GAF and ANTAR domain-containing protein [Saccharopolyspora sp. HNM0983]MBE9372954.1 GAF and ANTAR domain-containing protein [Saccharopolyspora sp. HNM0983]
MEHDLAQIMSTVARNLEAEPDEQQTLASIVQAAVATVPGVRFGGITRLQRKRIDALVPTDERVLRSTEAQEEVGEGPCLDAVRGQQTIVADDLGSDTRWPRFAARAHELGVGSLITFQLYVQQRTLGALSLYGKTGVRFGDEARLVGEVFATHAALALSSARQHRQLNEALMSRDAIGQAKGLLMRQHGITGQRAFDLLVLASQESNIKLTEVAAWLVSEHEEPRGSRPRSGE